MGSSGRLQVSSGGQRAQVADPPPSSYPVEPATASGTAAKGDHSPGSSAVSEAPLARSPLSAKISQRRKSSDQSPFFAPAPASSALRASSTGSDWETCLASIATTAGSCFEEKHTRSTLASPGSPAAPSSRSSRWQVCLVYRAIRPGAATHSQVTAAASRGALSLLAKVTSVTAAARTAREAPSIHSLASPPSNWHR